MLSRPIIAALIWILIGAVGLGAQDAKPDFSGTWTLDVSRSVPGPLPAPESLDVVIEHQDPSITSTLTQKGPDGVSTSKTTITTDGQENRNVIRSEEGEVTLTSRSRWSGRSLLIAASTTLEGTPIGVTETWTLSADGREMTVSRAFSSDQGAFQQKFVFTRRPGP